MNNQRKKVWIKNKQQNNAYVSPWTLKELLKIELWRIVWFVCYRPTPKHLCNRWRLFLLKLFGAKVSGNPFVYSSSRVFAPWLLSLSDHTCLGPNSEIYNLGYVVLGKKVTISQYVYVCNGTHDLTKASLPLMVGEIRIGDDVFIGAKAVILPGIEIGEGAVVGASAVVTKDVEPWTVVGGNPAKFIKKRIIEG